MDTAKKIQIAKTAVCFVASKSAGFVVASAINALVTPETSIQKIETRVGCAVIGSLVSAKVGIHTREKLDQLEAQIADAKTKNDTK